MGREVFDYYQRKIPASQDREAHAFAAIRYHELGCEADQYRLCRRAARVHRAVAGQPTRRPAGQLLAGALSWVHNLLCSWSKSLPRTQRRDALSAAKH
jgi:hypothetical protein